MYFMILIGQAVIMLFQLRSLMQSSPADYYNPFVQLVAKLTQPVVNLMPFRQAHIGGFFYAGALIALIFALLFWIVFMFVLPSGSDTIIREFLMALVLAFFMFIKSFGYLFLALLLVEAITSWLPSTRSVSYLCAQITSPLVSPIQKIIPPIGMIDISLMLIMIALFALNSLMVKLFGPLWLVF